MIPCLLSHGDNMTFYYPLPQSKQTTIKYDCEKCGLYSNTKLETPFFEPIIGENYNGLVILGQQPSKDDDFKSIPFSNKRAQLVRATAFKNGVNLKKVSAFVYALQCHSGKKTTDVQYRCCRERLKTQLEELKPKMVICCGEMAFKSLFDLKNKIPPTKLRGRLIPNFEFNCIVFTLLNPNDVYSFDRQYSIKLDIKRALKFWVKYNKRKSVNQLLEERKILKDTHIMEITNPGELEGLFYCIGKMKRIALDYETTNVKPYDKYFEITHIQFGNANNGWVINESLWKNYPVWKLIKEFMRHFLTDPSIEKIIQNVKFEENCSRWVFGIDKIINTQDPMLATHVIDERRGCTSLDFQNLIRFGIPPYSDTVKSFLKKKNKDDKRNRIRQAPYDDMITYAGLDVITTFHNWLFIEKILPIAYPQANFDYQFLHRGHQLFSNMTHKGINAGNDELEEIETTLVNHMEDVLTRITQIPEFIEYNKYLEDKTNLKSTSNKQLKTLSIKMKGDGKYEKSIDNDATNNNEKKKKPIRRKLSF